MASGSSLGLLGLFCAEAPMERSSAAVAAVRTGRIIPELPRRKSLFGVCTRAPTVGFRKRRLISQKSGLLPRQAFHAGNNGAGKLQFEAAEIPGAGDGLLGFGLCFEAFPPLRQGLAVG